MLKRRRGRPRKQKIEDGIPPQRGRGRPRKYKIENGIPLPGARGDSEYPIEQLKVGQSFFVSASGGDTARMVRNRLHNRASYLRRHFENMKARRYTIRTTGLGARIWRRE